MLHSLIRLVVITSLYFIAVPLSAAEKQIAPTKMQSTTTKNIVRMLNNRHYKKLDIDDELSVAYLEKYFENLDPQRMYFLAKDLKRFERFRTRFDDDFKAGRLNTSFDIYHLFRDRMTQRLTDVVAYLENPETKFDFKEDTTVERDREEADWPTSDEQAKSLWRKRVQLSVLNQKLSGKEVSKIIKTLTKRYKNQLNRVEQQTHRDIYEAAINALTTLYDPHTSYFSPRTSENFNISMSLSLEGIGAVLQSEDEYTKVVRLVAGGPAHKQGQLKPADKIVAISQGAKGEFVDVVGWRLDEVVDLIRGKKGTTVRLEVFAGEAGEHRIVNIKRDKVKLEDQAAKKAIFEVKEGEKTHKIGVIDVPAFYIDFKAARSGDRNYKSTTRDVARLVRELKAEEVTGIILDLRNNGGGSLQEATQLTDLFIDQGPVVQIRQSNGRISRENRAYNRAIYKGPLVVLINRLSASASEIFAGAIQDYKRGLVVGSQSFGKGTVQLLTRLPEGELKLTESKFYRVSGDSTQHRGVIPDIEMPVLVDHEEVGESTYENALPWDKIRPAAHTKYFDIPGMVPEIDQKHQARMALDPEFEFIRNQLALSESNKSRKFISLNEAVRIKEKEDFDSRALGYENKRRKARGLEPYKTAKEYRDAEKAEADRIAALPAGQHQPIDVDDDAILAETGNILIDFSRLLKKPSSKRLVKIPYPK